ncbi:MAG: right-handed parallel beta-helix repeat-containing protein [Phycisphaerales bacterium]|nr:right-handed parallel beta-helix repeat-containing protein [Phycisphaerales bacterium]
MTATSPQSQGRFTRWGVNMMGKATVINRTLLTLVVLIAFAPSQAISAYAAAALKQVSSPPLNHIFWASEPVRPNDAVLLAGSDLKAVTLIKVRRLDNTPLSASEKPTTTGRYHTVKPLQATAQSLKFILPTTLKMGVFECVVKSPGWSQTILLNTAHVWWIQGDSGTFSTPGGWLRTFGNSLSFGAPGEARLTAANGVRLTLRSPPGDGYALSFAIPSTLPVGVYQVSVCNGLRTTWSDAGAWRIKSPKPWPSQVFNVMDYYGRSARKEMLRTLGNYNPPRDRTAAVEAALKRAAHNGGGIVYFPPGKYSFTGQLNVPPDTILRGAGLGVTVLRFGQGGFALDGGNGKRRLTDHQTHVPPFLMSGGAYRVEDMSLYVPRHFKGGIRSGEHFQMKHVRIRVDRYWIRSGKEDNEVLLRMAGSSRVTHCNILAQGMAITYSGPDVLVAHNTIMAGKSPIALGNSDGAIIEDNKFVSVDPQAYINLYGQGRNVYYAHNRHVCEFEDESDFSFTFDGPGGAYLGKAAAVNGTTITLAQEPTYPRWAGEKSTLWRRSVVAVLSGTGAGQYRFVTANHGREWRINRPFTIAPDSTSTLSIIPFRGHVLIIGNRFEDANWVNMGYGSSFNVICADNKLYRCGSLLNYGLRLKSGMQPSWYVQYLDNDIYEGLTSVSVRGDLRWPQLFGGTVTRYTVLRGIHIHADNYGGISISGNARDVIVENSTLDNPWSGIQVQGQASDVLLHNNSFAKGSARYTGNRLAQALVLP